MLSVGPQAADANTAELAPAGLGQVDLPGSRASGKSGSELNRVGEKGNQLTGSRQEGRQAERRAGR